MGASAQSMLEKINQTELADLKFVCSKGLVDIYANYETDVYYAKVNEILLHNGYADGNLKMSRIQKSNLRYPRVCVSRETHPTRHTKPTIYIELNPVSIQLLQTLYPSIDMEHTLAIIPQNFRPSGTPTGGLNVEKLVQNFKTEVSELVLENQDLQTQNTKLKKTLRKLCETTLNSIHSLEEACEEAVGVLNEV